MFGIGMPELVLILAVALIVVGPRKLPELARSLGRAMQEFKKAANDLKSSINLDQEIKDIRHTVDDVKNDVRQVTEFHLDHLAAGEPPPRGRTEAAGEVPAEALPAEGKTIVDGAADGEDKHE